MQELPGITLLELVEHRYAELLLLCGELERVADALPRDVDRHACLRLGPAATAVTAQMHRLEEDVLFPALRTRWPHLAELSATLERLHLEHQSDEWHAEEVQDALVAFGEGRPQMSADAMGYLLRGFFEGQRRHIAFERELVRPLLAQVAALR